MDDVSAILNLVFRWLHVIAGVMWIGHLWFFNFVNAQLVKTYDADSKKKVLPELMPRALYWFRWGAAYTFITGILLFGIVYSMGGTLVSTETSLKSPGLATLVGLGIFVVGFLIYDVLWKSVFAKNEMAGAVVSFLLVAAVAFGLSRMVTGRALWISIGGLLGTIMAANVWMRIWPSQKKIIAGVKGTGPAADPSVAALAGLRSKHNTYMSMPLMFFMVGNHYQNIPIGSLDFGYSNTDYNWIVASLMVALGWGIAKLCYNKSNTATPAQF